jgi:ABC-type glycerol-3-phosphate transport system substrate-binding protein
VLRQVISALVVCLVLAACGGAGTRSATTAGTGGATTTAREVDSSTTTPQATTTVAAGTSDPGRPVAPDFTLELGEGGVYQLSEGARPVYLVFWAEW